MQVQSPRSLIIVVLGAGSIGVSFAALFADAGAQVWLVDPDAQRRANADTALSTQREAMALAGVSRHAGGAVQVTDDTGDVLSNCHLVLECGPENIEIKKAIFADLLIKAGKETILATASSAITMSSILPEPSLQNRCLVAHPVNPPAVLRVIELVPAPATDPEVCEKAGSIFHSVGFETVILGREIEGFVLNRLQGAVLREAYRLVEEGVCDVAGVDAIMRLGLGPRWALSGPFETAELNTPGGIKAHATRMGPAYKRMGEARGETVDWNEALVSEVAAQRRAQLPAEQIETRAAWRTRAVAALVAARDRLMTPAPDRDHDDT